MSRLCVRCKGNMLCGRSRCPITEKFRFLSGYKVSKHLIDPTPPSVFVGRYGYPAVNAGPLISITDAPPDVTDNPEKWVGGKIEDILRFRTGLVRGNFRVSVEEARDPGRMLQYVQEIALSSSPVDVEARFSKIREKKIRFDDTLAPHGVSGTVKDLRIVDNPKVPLKVEKAVGDTDARVSEITAELLDDGISTYHIQRLLSADLLGRKKERRLVPTRWAVTAIHDTAGKELINRILMYEQLNEFRLFSFEHFGNHFEVLLMPAPYFYEIVEIWTKNSLWSSESEVIEVDRERRGMRKTYSTLGGGYYAGRLPVLEYMNGIRKQAGVIIVREIHPSYWAPLGVWVVEEGVRNALKNRPEVYESLDQAIEKIKNRVRTPSQKWFPRLSMLREFKEQRSLYDFLDR